MRKVRMSRTVLKTFLLPLCRPIRQKGEGRCCRTNHHWTNSRSRDRVYCPFALWFGLFWTRLFSLTSIYIYLLLNSCGIHYLTKNKKMCFRRVVNEENKRMRCLKHSFQGSPSSDKIIRIRVLSSTKMLNMVLNPNALSLPLRIFQLNARMFTV